MSAVDDKTLPLTQRCKCLAEKLFQAENFGFINAEFNVRINKCVLLFVIKGVGRYS